MIRKKIICLLFLFTFFTIASQAQKQEQKIQLAKTVDSILQNAVHNMLLRGAVIEIEKGKEVLGRKAFGNADRNDYHNEPLTHPVLMTTDDRFDLASVTEVVGTTTSVMLLADRGLLKVDDPVGKY